MHDMKIGKASEPNPATHTHPQGPSPTRDTRKGSGGMRSSNLCSEYLPFV